MCFVDNHDIISLKLYDIGVVRQVLFQLLFFCVYAVIFTFILCSSSRRCLYTLDTF